MNLTELEFPLRTEHINNQDYIFDPVRKKMVVLTPEEWVRQHVLFLLHHQRQIPYSRMAIERQIEGTNKRFDILIYDNKELKPTAIIECKAQNIPINQSTLEQVSRYNHVIEAEYIIVTNWEHWIAARIKNEDFEFLNGFPTL